MSDLSKRQGAIMISLNFIEDEPEVVQYILKQIGFVPLRVECRYDHRRFEMTELSDHFEINNEACVTPEYRIQLSSSEDSENPGKISHVSVIRDK